jgi:hypothetical protein
MRSFIRHPTDIPIEVQHDRHSVASRVLRDVSHGGLCFRYASQLAPGDRVKVRIPNVSPPFEATSRVVWCQADGPAWQVGVEFLDTDDLFRVRMVEQICHIELYRRAQHQHGGRQLTGHEAALEWVRKFASGFGSFGADQPAAAPPPKKPEPPQR